MVRVEGLSRRALDALFACARLQFEGRSQSPLCLGAVPVPHVVVVDLERNLHELDARNEVDCKNHLSLLHLSYPVLTEVFAQHGANETPWLGALRSTAEADVGSTWAAEAQVLKGSKAQKEETALYSGGSCCPPILLSPKANVYC